MPLENPETPELLMSKTSVSPRARATAMGQTPRCIWFTGLSGAGKSTLANALDLELHQQGYKTFLLDGDNVRHGLTKDLGMTESGRAENIRRVGEVAKLMVDAGLIVICAFISPYRRDRRTVRELFEPDRFVEAYVSTSLKVCEQRDPKGLYKKARKGTIKQFTGVSDPYEPPEAPEVILDTASLSIEESVHIVREHLDE